MSEDCNSEPDRATEFADALLDAAYGCQDVDAELGKVSAGDAPAVLEAVVRALAGTIASHRLAFDPETTPADEPVPEGVEDPWHSDDPMTATMLAARALFDALVAQLSVSGLLAGVSALDGDAARTVVLERALWAMAERGPGA